MSAFLWFSGTITTPGTVSIDVVKRVMKKYNVNVNTPDACDTLPLPMAAYCNKLEMIVPLCDMGANVNSCGGSNGRTALHEAVSAGNSDMVQLLIELGADVNCMDGAGKTPVFDAAYKNYPQIIRLLHTYGADLETTCTHMFQPMHAAASKCHIECVRVLLELGGDMNATGGQNTRRPIEFALEQSTPDLLRVCIDAGVDIYHAVDFHETHGLMWRPALREVVSGVRRATENYRCRTKDRYDLYSIVKLASFACLGSSCPSSDPDLGPASSSSSSSRTVDNSSDALLDEATGQLSGGLVLENITMQFKRSIFESTVEGLMKSVFVPPFALVVEFRRLSYPGRLKVMKLCSANCADIMQLHPERSGVAVFISLLKLFWNTQTLIDVANLRMTCRLCESERRFPIPRSTFAVAALSDIAGSTTSISRLDSHLIEQFLGGDISYSVYTHDIVQAHIVYANYQANTSTADMLSRGIHNILSYFGLD